MKYVVEINGERVNVELDGATAIVNGERLNVELAVCSGHAGSTGTHR